MAGRSTPINLVALVYGEQVMTLDTDAPNVSHSLPATEPWPDLAELADACGVDAVMPIGPPRRLADPDRVIHVVTASGPPASVAGTTWAPLDGSAGLAVPAAVADVIVMTIEEHDGRRGWPARRPDWFRLGWLDEAERWIGDRLVETGLDRRGPAAPWRLWSLSAVLRVPVEGGDEDQAVWFKATCDWFRAEAAITAVLTSFADRCVPAVLTIDSQRPWMLMEQMSGVSRDDRGELGPAAATAVARLQLDALDHLGALAAAGCPDRTLLPTIDALHRLIHDSIELPMLTADERRAAIDVEPWITDQVAELFGCGFPASIVHGDLHLGDVAGDVGQAVLYDWTDACRSHPFLDGIQLSRSAGPDRETAVRRAFVEPWRTAFPGADVDRAWDLAVIVNRVFQAISYEAIYRAQEEESRWELAGVVADVLRHLGTEFSAGRD